MSDFYARLLATANRLIADKGQTVALVRMSTYGPPHNPAGIEARHDIFMVETGYSIINRGQNLATTTGPLVQSGDKLGIISAAGEAPQMSDKIEIGGVRYSFVDIKPLAPGGTTLLFEFHARK